MTCFRLQKWKAIKNVNKGKIFLLKALKVGICMEIGGAEWNQRENLYKYRCPGQCTQAKTGFFELKRTI